MKRTAILLSFLLFSGCASLVTKGVDQVRQVRDAINSLLPSDFKGDVDLSRHDSYFDITLKAGNLHKNEAGEWSWTWIEYQRDTHIPIAGIAWQSKVTIKLGKP